MMYRTSYEMTQSQAELMTICVAGGQRAARRSGCTLHSRTPLCNGDLKCSNALLEGDGWGAVIAGFWLARGVRDAGGMRQQQW
jgi:hypothetical protein